MDGAGRIRGRPQGQRRGDEVVATSAGSVGGRGLLDDVNGLLDEIDAVLEENAEEFVRGYVQKGGE